MTEPDQVRAAREAYRDACVACCEGSYSLPFAAVGSALHRKAVAAREALSAALAAQQASQQDGHAMCALAAAIGAELSCKGAGIDEPVRVMAALRAAGWRLTRAEPPTAPAAPHEPQTRQETLRDRIRENDELVARSRAERAAAQQEHVQPVPQDLFYVGRDGVTRTIKPEALSLLDEDGYLRALPRELRDLQVEPRGFVFAAPSLATTFGRFICHGFASIADAQALAALTAKQIP